MTSGVKVQVGDVRLIGPTANQARRQTHRRSNPRFHAECRRWCLPSLTILRATKPAMSPRTIEEDNEVPISSRYASRAMKIRCEHLAIGFIAYLRIMTGSVRWRT